MSRTVYVIYDERAMTEGTDDAAVLESCGSLKEVKRTTWDGVRDPLGAVYEYDLVKDAKGNDEAINERFVGTVPQLKAQ